MISTFGIWTVTIKVLRVCRGESRICEGHEGVFEPCMDLPYGNNFTT